MKEHDFLTRRRYAADRAKGRRTTIFAARPRSGNRGRPHNNTRRHGNRFQLNTCTAVAHPYNQKVDIAGVVHDWYYQTGAASRARSDPEVSADGSHRRRASRERLFRLWSDGSPCVLEAGLPGAAIGVKIGRRSLGGFRAGTLPDRGSGTQLQKSLRSMAECCSLALPNAYVSKPRTANAFDSEFFSWRTPLACTYLLLNGPKFMVSLIRTLHMMIH